MFAGGGVLAGSSIEANHTQGLDLPLDEADLRDLDEMFTGMEHYFEVVGKNTQVSGAPVAAHGGQSQSACSVERQHVVVHVVALS